MTSPTRTNGSRGLTPLIKDPAALAELMASSEADAADSPAPSIAPPALNRRPGISPARFVELLVTFAFGFALMQFIYLDPRETSAVGLGAPGVDSFYHTRMAVMLPEVGLVDTFPWLQYVYFSPDDSGFISHHYGFHVLLTPFVHASHWLTGDYLLGARLAISVFFGLSLLFMQAILMAEGVRFRMLWLIAFLLLPPDFFGRHSFVRAISPSLMFMLGILWLMFRERAVWAGIAVAGYVHLYLGSVVYTPVLVGVYAVACLVGPRGDRRFPWRVVLWTMLGWLVGLRTYPYFDGALEFLRMQILGSGLDPDIAVGGEWNSYGNVWQFAFRSCGPLLGLWTACLLLRVRLGGRLNPREMTLMVLQFAFLFLTLKAQRFIEYWPPLCLLSAAFLAAPVLNPLAHWLDPVDGPATTARRGWRRAAVGVALMAALAVAIIVLPLNERGPFAAQPLTWACLAAAFMAGPLLTIWLGNATGPLRYVFASLVALIIAGFAAVSYLVLSRVPAAADLVRDGLFAEWGIAGRYGPWAALALLFVVGAVWQVRRCSQDSPTRGHLRAAETVSVLALGMAVFLVVVLVGAKPASARQREVRCSYHLVSIKDTMDYLQKISRPGDIVFTDDWDIFPVFFYHNAYNHFIVGLDPKFTQWRKPVLWERYVRLTRGQAPRDCVAHWTGADGSRASRAIHVDVSDIRTYFHARYVVTDRDHPALAKLLAERPDFARLVYPQTDYERCTKAPFLIFEVIEPSAPGGKPPEAIYLSDLEPVEVEQGWGSLQMDRSVSDQPLQLDTGFHLRGLGTHAPSRITFEVPDGVAVFEAQVGVSQRADGPGTVTVSVEVDGETSFQSPLLTRGGGAVAVRIDLQDAKRLTLRADPTDDGQRWDHVDWVDARFLHADASSAPHKRQTTHDRRSRP